MVGEIGKIDGLLSETGRDAVKRQAREAFGVMREGQNLPMRYEAYKKFISLHVKAGGTFRHGVPPMGLTMEQFGAWEAEEREQDAAATRQAEDRFARAATIVGPDRRKPIAAPIDRIVEDRDPEKSYEDYLAVREEDRRLHAGRRASVARETRTPTGPVMTREQWELWVNQPDVFMAQRRAEASSRSSTPVKEVPQAAVPSQERTSPTFSSRVKKAWDALFGG